jgi:hypothetical protein
VNVGLIALSNLPDHFEWSGTTNMSRCVEPRPNITWTNRCVQLLDEILLAMQFAARLTRLLLRPNGPTVKVRSTDSFQG